MHIQTVFFTPARLVLVLAIAASAFSIRPLTPPVQADSSSSPLVQEQPESVFSCVGVEGIPELECQALVAVYESFNGQDWTDSRGWLESNQPCNWEGVSCEEGHVTQLGFLRAGVSGTLPAAIGDLPYLQLLNLETNQLSGELPSELGSLTQLTYLNLKNNQFSGTLPETIGNLENLTELDLINNQFSGSLPSSFWSLTGLTHLYLGNNNFSGQIPADIANLAQLKDLEIGKNQFTGSLPSEIGNLTNLNYLSINENPLTGSLPQTIGNLTSLWTLQISNTSLGGEVPHTIVNLEYLRSLYLNDNQFTGCFPYIGELLSLRSLDLSGNHFEDFDPVISSLPWLETLNLSNNNLSGYLPHDFFIMDSIRYLDLSNNQLNWISDLTVYLPQLETLKLGKNQFSSAILSPVFNLPKLQHLYLEDNQLSGTLPGSLWTNSQLVNLDLSGNAITGQLPATFNMPALFSLNLSNNQLEGQLPASINSMLWLRTLDLSDNQFSGQIPNTFGSLVDLRTLDIHANHFYGEIPSSITNLVNLNEPVWSAEPNGYTDLGHNHLTAANPAVRSFLAEKDPDWESIQTYGYLPPTLVSIQPSMLMAGAGNATLKVHGSNFVNGAVVYWNAEAVPTKFQSTILLTASIPASKLSSPGSFEIIVKNPEPTVGPSNSKTIYITPSSSSQTIRISLTNIGEEGNGPSSNPSISEDGRYIAFDSRATNLLPGNPNGHLHVYVYDRQNEQLERVSVTSTGELAHGSLNPKISANGRFVAFVSWSPNLVPAYSEASWHIFIHDRVTGQTELVSKSSTGSLGNGSSDAPSLSADGRYIAFQSDSNNLVANDNNEQMDVFVHDRETGVTKRVSISSQGEEAEDRPSRSPHVSADGRFVAFVSGADNLVPDDNNHQTDVFIHELETGITERASLSSTGAEANNLSGSPMLSANGRYVVFFSSADNLVPGLSIYDSHWKVYVRDRQTGTTEIVTPYRSPQFSANSGEGTISHDGRLVAFVSTYKADHPGQFTDYANVYIFDRETGVYSLQNITYNALNQNNVVYPFISGNGRYIAFQSEASNIVPGDTNNKSDVFVYDRCLDGSCSTSEPIHPKPSLLALNPSGSTPTDSALQLVIRGDHFIEGALVYWDEEIIPSNYLNDNKLLAMVPAGKLTNPATIEVYVKNPWGSGGVSNPFRFYISNIQPASGSTALTRRPEFGWPAEDTAASFQVQISTSSSFSTLLMTLTSSTNTVLPTADLPLNTTVYWRVRARVNGVYQAWSQRYSFRSANPPSNPSLVSPANNALTTNYVPKLTWSQSSLPSGTIFEHYQLQIATVDTFIEEFLVLDHDVTSRTAPNYTPPPGLLLSNTQYFWRVRAVNTLGHVSNWSKVFILRAAMLPIDPLPEPAGLTPRPTFSWSPREGASSYTIQISVYANFSILLANTSLAGTSYTPTQDLPKNRTIHWRVRANGLNGPSLWAASSFKSANPPSTPSQVSPVSNALVTTYTPRLSWRASSLPTDTVFKHYRLQVSKFKEFPDELGKTIEKLIDTRTTPFYQFVEEEKLDSNALYYWRVQAWNTNNHYSTWSAVRSFRSAVLPPVLDQPSEGITVTSLRPLFSWADVEGASSYTIQLSRYANFSELLKSASIQTPAYNASANLPQNRTIYWRVRASGPNGPSLWSASKFISPNPPSTPGLVSPANGATIKTLTPRLDWSTSTLPAGISFLRYELEIALDTSFTSPIRKEVPDRSASEWKNWAAEESLLPKTRYYWRVRAVNTYEHISSWSSRWSFVTP